MRDKKRKRKEKEGQVTERGWSIAVTDRGLFKGIPFSRTILRFLLFSFLLRARMDSFQIQIIIYIS